MKVARTVRDRGKGRGAIWSEPYLLSSFAKAINKANSINIKEATDDMFVCWLSVITEKEIINKDIIENARKEKEVIQMAVSAIARQSEDKIMRQAYQRRKDEIYFNNLERAEDRRKLEQSEAENLELRKEIAELQAQLANKK